MSSLLTKVLLAIFGVGGTITLIVVPTSLAGGGKKQRVITRESYQKRNCYKWMYEYGKGEVIACDEWNKSGSLFFVLWWIKDNTFTEIDQIKVESDNQISFVFQPSTTQKEDRKLKIKPYWSPTNTALNNLTNISELNNKSLKETCKIQGSELVCGGYKSSYRNLQFYFYLTVK